MYKRLSDGYFQWPKYAEDVRKLTQEQFLDLMEGFAIERKVTIRKVIQSEFGVSRTTVRGGAFRNV